MAFAYKLAAGLAAAGATSITARRASCDDKSDIMRQGFFDPEALERGAKAIREIDRSSNAKSAYAVLREQEVSKQAESKAKEAEMQAARSQYEQQTERLRQEEEYKREQLRAQSQGELMQRQAQFEQQKMQQEHELRRQRDAEYLQAQKKASLEVEESKLSIVRQMEAEKRATSQHEAEMQKQVAIERALAEGRARAQEHRENRDIFMEEISKSASEWGKQYLLLLQESFTNLGTGARLLLTTEYGPQALYGAAGLLAAYYGIRGGFGVAFGQLERFLTTPPLVRETSRYDVMNRVKQAFGFGGPTAVAMDKALASADKTFSDVILGADVKHNIRALAASAANTRLHGAPFRHFLFYGPPGTGKTLVAKRLAHTSGLDYAIMSGGDVAPLGALAVKQIHDTFNWAKRSKRGMILFVDEADAFLSRRDGEKSEAMRSAINAMLYRTGDQSRDFMVILATNRPEDLDKAVLDRIDEQHEIGLPDPELREQLLHLYYSRYVENAEAEALKGMGPLERLGRGLSSVLRGQKAVADRITVRDFDKVSLLRDAAQATEGFSGREIAKFMASVQAAAYATPDACLTPEIFKMVLKNKLRQHKMRMEFEHHG